MVYQNTLFKLLLIHGASENTVSNFYSTHSTRIHGVSENSLEFLLLHGVLKYTVRTSTLHMVPEYTVRTSTSIWCVRIHC